MTNTVREKTAAALNRDKVRLVTVALQFHHGTVTLGALEQAARRFGRAWDDCCPPQYAAKKAVAS